VLGQNITMDKLAVSMHSAYLQNKAAVQTVVKKGTLGPVKANDPGGIQERVRRGPEGSRQGGVPLSLRVVVRAVQNKCSP